MRSSQSGVGIFNEEQQFTCLKATTKADLDVISVDTRENFTRLSSQCPTCLTSNRETKLVTSHLSGTSTPSGTRVALAIARYFMGSTSINTLLSPILQSIEPRSFVATLTECSLCQMEFISVRHLDTEATSI